MGDALSRSRPNRDLPSCSRPQCDTHMEGSQMFNDNGSFLLAMFEFFIFFAWIMCLFYVFADIFRSHDLGGGAKTIWCIFIIIVPFLGVFVYLIARGHGMTQRSIEQQQQMQAQQADYVRSVVATSSSVQRRPDRLGQEAPRRGNDHPGGVRPDEGEGSRHCVTWVVPGYAVRSPIPISVTT